MGARDIVVGTKSLVTNIVLSTFTLGGCLAGEEEQQTTDSISTIAEARAEIEEGGLSCSFQQFLFGLDEQGRLDLIDSIAQDMDTEEIHDLLASREVNCTEGADSSTLSFRSSWIGEIIEEDNGGSTQTAPYMITRDISGPSNVCGGEWPYDYIAHYSKLDVYDNRPDLRLDGSTGAARLILGSTQSARVYDDDKVWVCFGYLTVNFWGQESDLYDAELWIQ